MDSLTHLFEYPWTAEGSPAHHHSIHPIALKGKACLFACGDVAVADDRDMYARVVLHLAYQGPVRLPRVHLRTRPTMDGERTDATVLQLFSERGDDKVVGVPSQSSLHRHGQVHRLHHLPCDLQEQRNVLQHSGAGTLARHLFHRAAEVDVDDIRVRLFHNTCRLYHRSHIPAINLYAHRTLFVRDIEFGLSRFHRPHQSLGTHKLSVNHRGTKPFTQHSKTDIRYILHRSQKDRTLPQVDLSNLHLLYNMISVSMTTGDRALQPEVLSPPSSLNQKGWQPPHPWHDSSSSLSSLPACHPPPSSVPLRVPRRPTGC